MPNPYHEKAGSSIGGQFARKEGGGILSQAEINRQKRIEAGLILEAEHRAAGNPARANKPVKTNKEAEDIIASAARKASGVDDLREGDEVEFINPMPDEVDKVTGKQLRSIVVEDRGDRVLIRTYIPGWNPSLMPTAVVNKADLKKVKKD
jgi:hypothetical protein